MITNEKLLAELVESEPQIDEFLTHAQAFLLDRALIWSLVEEGYPELRVGLLGDIHDREEVMSLVVLEILWELNGKGPVTDEEVDIWL